MANLHVVLGASGGAGNAVVRALASEGKRIRAVSRSGKVDAPGEFENVRADALDVDAVIEACRGASAVYHCVNVPYASWAELLPTVMENAIRGAGEADAVLVYCDNLYLYGPVSGPMTENTPASDATKKGAIRARLADMLLKAHSDGEVRATIGRASDFFGPGATNSIAGLLVFPAVVKGKRARWLGSLDAPHSVNYIDDVGRALVLLASDEKTLGEVWHVPAPPPVTGRQFIEMSFDLAGKRSKMGVYPRWMMRLAGIFDRQLKELVEMMYQFEDPFVLDAEKFAVAFPDYQITPMRDAIAASLEWEREQRAQ